MAAFQSGLIAGEFIDFWQIDLCLFKIEYFSPENRSS